jgi:calcineurin-like phosphoesterase family protein
MIYFTADQHYYHENIMKYSHRPFYTINDMNMTITKNWNNTIKPNDEVYILGDFAFTTTENTNELLKNLNGRKYLIKGNHDRFLSDNKFDRTQFIWVKDYYILKYREQKIVLFHYPIYEWDCAFHGSIHLYGHVHNNEQMDRKNAFNVGVDVNNFTPISIEDIIKRTVQ